MHTLIHCIIEIEKDDTVKEEIAKWATVFLWFLLVDQILKDML